MSAAGYINKRHKNIFFPDMNVRSDVQVARMMTDRKRRHYVSLYNGSFIPYQQLELHSVIGEGQQHSKNS